MQRIRLLPVVMDGQDDGRRLRHRQTHNYRGSRANPTTYYDLREDEFLFSQ